MTVNQIHTRKSMTIVMFQNLEVFTYTQWGNITCMGNPDICIFRQILVIKFFTTYRVSGFLDFSLKYNKLQNAYRSN